jgi:EpsI family protein
LLLLVGTALNVLANARPEAPIDSRTTALPASIGAWTRAGAWEGSARPRFTGADEQGTGRYVLGSSHVSVFLGRYAVQRQGSEVVFYSNRPSGEGAEVLARATARVALAGGEAVSLAELEVVDLDGVKRVVWYGYEIAGSRAREPFRAKLYQVAGAFRRRWDAQVIVASSACEPDCAAAREALAHLMTAGYELVLASAAKEESQ